MSLSAPQMSLAMSTTWKGRGGDVAEHPLNVASDVVDMEREGERCYGVVDLGAEGCPGRPVSYVKCVL